MTVVNGNFWALQTTQTIVLQSASAKMLHDHLASSIGRAGIASRTRNTMSIARLYFVSMTNRSPNANK